jgi:hypothetical protein
MATFVSQTKPEMLDSMHKQQFEPTLTKYTPKRPRASDGQIFGKMEN